MEYASVRPARFLDRPNRFIAHVDLDGTVLAVHVKNTGRCRELLVPGAQVWLSAAADPARKTPYDLIAVQKGDRLINMDSQAPNQVFGEAAPGLLGDPTLLRPETVWGDSRFDFYWEAPDRRGFVEVKGVTLERAGAAFFPDAPTQRGVKHLRELIRAKAGGYEAAVCFVIQMEDIAYLSPNDATHPAFGDALRDACRAGVDLWAFTCRVTPGSLTLADPVPIRL